MARREVQRTGRQRRDHVDHLAAQSRRQSHHRRHHLHRRQRPRFVARRLEDHVPRYGERRADLPLRRLHDARRLRFQRSHLRTGTAPGRRVELSRRVHRLVAGQHQHRRAAHALQRGLRLVLEQHLAQPLQQPLRARPLRQLRSRRHHRLLLPLRPRLRPHHRRLSRAYWRGSHVRQVGLRLLAVQEPLQVAGRTARRGAQIPRAAHSHRRHCAGLVLVEPQGRARLQPQVPRSQGHDRRPAQEQLPLDDLGVALLRARLEGVRDHGQERLVHRQDAQSPSRPTTPQRWPCTTPPIPKRASITGS